MDVRRRLLPVLAGPLFPELASPAKRAEPVAVRSSSVTATLESVGRGGRDARLYRLHVANESQQPVEADVFACGRTDIGERYAPTHVVVGPDAAATVAMKIAIPRGRRYRVVGEIHAPSATFLIEATDPSGGVVPLASVLRGFVAACAAAAAVAFAVDRPAVTALAAPPTSDAAQPLTVGYALANARSAAYTVTTQEGERIDGGPLSRDGGSFQVALPARAIPERYRIAVDATGALGAATRSVDVVALAAAAPPVAAAPLQTPAPRRSAPPKPFKIDRLALAKDTVAGGQPIEVDYRVSDVDGTVRLIDAQGTVRAEALLRKRGDSIVLAPLVTADEDFRVVVQAAHGRNVAEASVPVRVTKALSMDDALAAARRAGTGPIVLAAPKVASGASIDVGIVDHEPAMHVSLVDAQGNDLGHSDVAANQNVVSLTAPTVRIPTTYTVLATYASGAGQETAIRSVTIDVPPPATSG